MERGAARHFPSEPPDGVAASSQKKLILYINLIFYWIIFPLLLFTLCPVVSNEMSGLNYQPLKVINGSFHQADLRFGYTAGIQCSCSTIISICYSKFRKLCLWKFHDLDYILNQGDANFKQLGFTKSPYVDEFPRQLMLENYLCSIDCFMHHGEFVSKDTAVNFVSKELLTSNCGAILVISGYSVAIIFQQGKFHVFDPHSRDQSGNVVQNGTSVLMQFLSLQQIRHYIQQMYETNFYQVLYVKTSFQSFDLMKAALSKSVLNRQKRISKEKLRTCEVSSGKSENKKNDRNKSNESTGKTGEHSYGKITGAKYENRKAKMRKVSKDQFDEIRGTKKHQKVKARKRKASKDRFNEIRGTDKHETIKAK